MDLLLINCYIIGIVILLLIWNFVLLNRLKFYIETLSKNMYFVSKTTMKNQEDIKEKINELKEGLDESGT